MLTTRYLPIQPRALLPFLGRAGQVLLAAVMAWLVQSIYRWYQVRSLFRKLQVQGIPIMPHSFLWGHLFVMKDLMQTFPRDLHPNYLAQIVMDNWKTLFPDQPKCPSLIYIDIWPMAPPLLFPIDPDLTAQFLTDNSLPKAKSANMYLKPLTGNLDLVSADGAAWKVWRSRFNPGFSPKNIIALVPAILDEVAVFAKALRDKAGKDSEWGEVFPLEGLTTNLTLDVIARAVLDIRLHEQTSGPSRLKSALLHQLSLCMFDFNIFTIWSWISPLRALNIARNTRTMRDFLLPSIQERMASETTTTNERSASRKTVVDLALKEFNSEEGVTSQPPDQVFIDVVIAQLKVFLFAGHDTTATSICWALHVLAKNLTVRAKVCAEHDAVLGPDPCTAVARLREEPHLLNALPYTLAVLKESLRLYPVVGPIRDGHAGFMFNVPSLNTLCPTAGFMVWDGIRASTRWSELWVRPLDFIPERWLVADPGDPLYPHKNAWHPFGIGPRNCIGQELAMVEMKLVLVLVARELEVECAWDEWDALRNNQGAKILVGGHRCYQCGAGTPHAKDGMPVHIRLAKA